MNQELFDNQLPTSTPRPELDIVRDCSDLMGKFPSNVKLKFVYWRHGNPDDADDFEGQSSRLAPHCLQADVIAQEVATTAHANPNDAHREMQKINDFLSGEVVNINFDEYFGELLSTSMIDSCLELATTMKSLGQTKPPKFIAVDVLDNIDADTFNIDVALETGLLEWAVAAAAIMRRREAVTIRQLYAESCKLAQDGAQHQIAIVYGSNHTFLSVATRALGAKTSRLFVDKPSFLVVQQLERSLRYRQAAEIQPEIEAAEAADEQGFLIKSLAKRVGITIEEIAPESTEPLDLYTKLGIVCLRATKDRLLKADHKVFNSALRTLEPFLEYDKKVPLMKRRGVKKAAQRIIELVDKLLAGNKLI